MRKASDAATKIDGRPYILRTQPGADVLIIALHGFRQHPLKGSQLKGRLSLPFITFCGFNKFPFPVNVVYPVGIGRNWRTKWPNVWKDHQYIVECERRAESETKSKMVVLFGFSDGGTMANYMRQFFPYKATCIASGWMPSVKKKSLDGGPVLLHTGDKGMVESQALEQAIKAEAMYNKAGVDVTRVVTAGIRHDWPAEMNQVLAEFILAARR